MMWHHLADILTQWGIGSAASRQLFADKARLLELPKQSILFTEGKANHSEYLLLTGVAHRCNATDAGNRVTTGFYRSPAVITPHFARTHRGKSLFSLQALTAIAVAEIPVAALDDLRSEYREFAEFGQRVVEAELRQAMHQEVALRASTASERLLAMRQQYPNLENEVPHHLIASYLGITQVSFSRLRHSLARKAPDFIK